MTVLDNRIVDWLGIEKQTGHVLMTIIDDLDWSEEMVHILRLQEKLNAYLSFIESGEVFSELRTKLGLEVTQDTQVKVSILAKYKVTSRGEIFLEHAKKQVRGHRTQSRVQVSRCAELST